MDDDSTDDSTGGSAVKRLTPASEVLSGKSMNAKALIGWILFALSGLAFLAVGIREADLLSILAAVLWTVGCVVFLSDR